MNRSLKTLKNISLIFLVLLFLLASGPVRAARNLYVYEPYTIGADVAGLINSAENYFSSRGTEVNFQPVANFDQFKQLLSEAEYVVMPVWAYYNLREKFSLVPLSTASVEGEKTKTWKLLAPEGSKITVNNLHKYDLAMMKFGTKTGKILEDILLSADVSGIQLNIVNVSKPLDALMAVKFGQVEAAIINSMSLKFIKKKQPNLVEGLQVVKESSPLLQTSLFAKNSGQHKQIEDLFLQMDESSSGRALLERLNFDSWVINREF